MTNRAKLTASYLANLDQESLFTLVYELEAEVERIRGGLQMIKLAAGQGAFADSIIRMSDAILLEGAGND